MKPSHRRHSGFLLLDTVVGFIIAGVLATALVTAIITADRAQRRLEEGTAAMRYAQRAMSTLREGKSTVKTIDEAQIEVQSVAGGETVPGQAWVRVVATYHGRTASLIGLTPRRGDQ